MKREKVSREKRTKTHAVTKAVGITDCFDRPIYIADIVVYPVTNKGDIFLKRATVVGYDKQSETLLCVTDPGLRIVSIGHVKERVAIAMGVDD